MLTDRGTIYVYGENHNGQLGLGHNDHKFGELVRSQTFKNEEIIDVECGPFHCYFLATGGTVFGSGPNFSTFIPKKIMKTHFVTKLLTGGELFIADRGKIINSNGRTVNRFISRIFTETFYGLDHFDFLCEGKVITVLKSALYPMEKFSKNQMLDPYFSSYPINDKLVTYKKLMDFFYYLSLYEMIQGDYDLKHFEFYFKGSSDAYSEKEVQLQSQRVEKFTSKVAPIYNGERLKSVKERMKNFIQVHHSNITCYNNVCLQNIHNLTI